MRIRDLSRSLRSVFNNGRSKAIRIPREFEFEADRVEIRMDEAGDLIVHPLKRKSLLEVLATMEPLGEEDQMPEIEDYPPEPFELDIGDER